MCAFPRGLGHLNIHEVLSVDTHGLKDGLRGIDPGYLNFEASCCKVWQLSCLVEGHCELYRDGVDFKKLSNCKGLVSRHGLYSNDTNSNCSVDGVSDVEDEEIRPSDGDDDDDDDDDC